MYITYYMRSGLEYARIDTTRRDGSGKVVKTSVNLGRVLDKNRLIFRNRERGVFTYDPAADTYAPAPEGFTPPLRKRRGKNIQAGTGQSSRQVIQFGDIYFYHEIYRQLGIGSAIDEIICSNRDTLNALLCYYVTSCESIGCAGDWYDLSYARILWPDADMSSQKISDTLAQIGLEQNRRAFFAKYCDFVRSCDIKDHKNDKDLPETGEIGEIGDGILIDTTGLANDARLQFSDLNRQNVQIIQEIRIFYVVRQSTGLPLYLHCVPGTVTATSVLQNTIAELQALHINTGFALLDAGYYNGVNADMLCDAGISFVSRVHDKHAIFANALRQYRNILESWENLTIHNDRIIFVKECEVRIGSKGEHKAYGYLCLDTITQIEDRSMFALRFVDENISGDCAFDELRKKGIFMLVSTRHVAKKDILKLYSTRNQAGEIFKISCNSEKPLPLCAGSGEILKGHLLMTFVAASMHKILADMLVNTDYTVSGVFSLLRHQQAIISEKEFIISETFRKMNDIYRTFKIKNPVTVAMR